MALGACAAPRDKASAQLSQVSGQSARTRADHSELSRRYADEARRLNAEALEHERIAGSYAVWGRHCANLARTLRAASQESSALARLHEEAAAAALE